jgi:hypothetical protein
MTTATPLADAPQGRERDKPDQIVLRIAVALRQLCPGAGVECQASPIQAMEAAMSRLRSSTCKVTLPARNRCSNGSDDRALATTAQGNINRLSRSG